MLFQRIQFEVHKNRILGPFIEQNMKKSCARADAIWGTQRFSAYFTNFWWLIFRRGVPQNSIFGIFEFAD